MIELSPGSGIFVFEKHRPGCSKKNTKNCFYTNTEMAGMNLTGANGKPCPEKDIIDSILGEFFTILTNPLCSIIKALYALPILKDESNGIFEVDLLGKKVN